MKKYFYALGFIFFITFSLSAQQIPNPGFEDWSNNKPDSWATSNQSIPLLGNFNTVTKENNDPQQGTASVKLTVLKINIPFSGTYTLPGLLTLGKINIDVPSKTATVTGGIPFTVTPEKLTGSYNRLRRKLIHRAQRTYRCSPGQKATRVDAIQHAWNPCP